MSETVSPRVAIIMGSDSDWRVMKAAATTLADLGVASLWRVVSAHRTPEDLGDFAAEAEATGIAVIIAGAGGAAHLPGMIASYTVLPVIGVPIQTTALMGLDALLSIVQMPRGIPVATVAVDGAANAALLAARILATGDPALAEQLRELRAIMAADSRNKTAKLVLE